MPLVEKLNQAGEYGYIKFTDLVIGEKYKVEAFKIYESMMNNISRKCLRVNIKNGFLILPERYDDLVKTILSEDIENLFISYHGRKEGNRMDVRFSEEKP